MSNAIKSEIFRFAHKLRKESGYNFNEALKLAWAYVLKRSKQFKVTYNKVEKSFIKITSALVTVGLPYAQGVKERFNMDTAPGNGGTAWAIYNSIGIMEHRTNGTQYLTCFFDQVTEQRYTDLNGNPISANHPDILKTKEKIKADYFDPGFRTIKYNNITQLQAVQATEKEKTKVA